ncbi:MULTISPECIES: WG repeat-containing protein [Prevotellaceae]|uniref:WG repeat-containing protein n=1 Tax=Prevotellaceae TaxID=171552 RepID=UPI00041289C2|nr:WG repeat-containing protein [Prevotella phocaeensis]
MIFANVLLLACCKKADSNGLIGFADTRGNLVIPPKYKFAYPFVNGKAKVTDMGILVVDGQSAEHNESWQSDKWYFISRRN